MSILSLILSSIVLIITVNELVKQWDKRSSEGEDGFTLFLLLLVLSGHLAKDIATCIKVLL